MSDMRAIILAAGQGTRLRPLTDNLPKCMVPFQGKPLVAHSVHALEKAGIQEIVFVIGYRGDQIEEHFGDSCGRCQISYVTAKDYETTNNIVSFGITSTIAQADITLLLEGDLIYDSGLISALLENPENDVAIVDPWKDTMDGSVIVAEHDKASQLTLKKDQPEGFDYRSALKTVNIYKFCRKTLNAIYQETGKWIENGRTNEYYEAVFSEMIASKTLKLTCQNIAPFRWAETDTIDDLKLAEALFSGSVTG